MGFRCSKEGGICMEVFNGKSVFGGIAIGKIYVYQKGEQQVRRIRVDDTAQEKSRYRAAAEEAMKQLQALYEKALQEDGEENAAVFEVHQMMLEDDDFVESVENIIDTQEVNAEYAVAVTGDNFAQIFAAMDDDYMRGRAAEVKDIRGNQADEPVIVLADDLAPSETVQMDKDKVLSFVTVHGSLNSHTAILARTMGIPALVQTGISLDEALDGKMAVVDGTKGCIYVEPDKD